MKTALLALSLLFAPALALADLDSEEPMIHVGAGAQAVRGEGLRALIRVSYAGKEKNVELCNCSAPSPRCGDRYFIVDGRIGLGLSGQSWLASAELNFTPFQSYEGSATTTDYSELSGSFLPARFSRDIALGKDGKLTVDLIGISYAKHPTPTRAEPVIAFFSATVNALGAQALMATREGAQAVAQGYAGLDVGRATAEAGLAQRWTQGFSTRVTVGGAADFGVVANAHGVKISSERSAFARVSAILDRHLYAIEAYVQGDVGQMQVGTDAREYVSLQAGALTRF